jgi:LysM repeat protein
MNRTFNILLVVGCVMSVVAAFLVSVKPAGTSSVPMVQSETDIPLSLPPLDTNPSKQTEHSGIARKIQLYTELQDDVFYEITEYTAKTGDSLWSIAQQFDLEPETILWGNEWLSSAGILQIGDTLNILPIDGVLHTVRDGDTLETLQTLGEHLDFRLLYGGTFLNPLEYLP